MEIDKALINSLFEQAEASPRRRMNYDLRTSPADTSQRMLNALLPGTQVPIHQHAETAETVICLAGRLDEIIYEIDSEYTRESDSRVEDVSRNLRYKEVKRYHLCPAEGRYGCQIPSGVWHTIEVFEPSVIFEAKDGAYK